MVTLTDIIKQSIEEITTTLAHQDRGGWQLCNGLVDELVEVTDIARREYQDFSNFCRLSMGSYYLSFLALFFQRKGAVRAAQILENELLNQTLHYLSALFVADDHNYKGIKGDPEEQTVKFLNRWLASGGSFSAQTAKKNCILDILIRYDQLNETNHSSRVLNDIRYIVYSLATQDSSVSNDEQQLLNFLEAESNKVRSAIGDRTEVDIEKYAESLEIKNREQLLREAHEELDRLIGLSAIKEEIKKLEAFLDIQRKREELGLAVTGLTLHFVFRGNPGTGKTTVARILGKLFKGLGYLEKGHVEETDRSGLVAEYLGQTAAKTMKRAEAALDGILFIDEAYGLSRSSGDSQDSYGREAIETVLKFMEDNRKRVVVIVAGYPELMKEFINTNPGLKSRFTRYLEFDDFSPLELCQIAQLFAAHGDYAYTHEAISALAYIFKNGVSQKIDGFGNGRFVRNVFEKTLQNQAVRLSDMDEEPSREKLVTLEASDLPSSIDGREYLIPEDVERLPLCSNCERRQVHCPEKFVLNRSDNTT